MPFLAHPTWDYKTKSYRNIHLPLIHSRVIDEINYHIKYNYVV